MQTKRKNFLLNKLKIIAIGKPRNKKPKGSWIQLLLLNHGLFFEKRWSRSISTEKTKENKIIKNKFKGVNSRKIKQKARLKIKWFNEFIYLEIIRVKYKYPL